MIISSEFATSHYMFSIQYIYRDEFRGNFIFGSCLQLNSPLGMLITWIERLIS